MSEPSFEDRLDNIERACDYLASAIEEKADPSTDPDQLGRDDWGDDAFIQVGKIRHQVRGLRRDHGDSAGYDE